MEELGGESDLAVGQTDDKGWLLNKTVKDTDWNNPHKTNILSPRNAYKIESNLTLNIRIK